MENKELILEFLQTPLSSGKKIFEKFAALPGAISKKGALPLQDFVYIPGTREDRVLLVAHADSCWDAVYLKTNKEYFAQIDFENGVFSSKHEKIGIGADDRAGCAMLWKLKDLGHSILVVNGEEKGRVGARFLKDENKALFKEINRHAYILELDHLETDHVSYQGVYSTKAFKQYISEQTGFKEKGLPGGCDIDVLCKDVCGANIGIGYHNCHKPSETLVLAEWENTYNKLVKLLEKPQNQFKISAGKKLKRFFKRCVLKLKRILKK